jgi:hypothetical protein
MSPRILSLALVAACAGPTKTAPQTAGSGSQQIVCQEVTPTGSLFSHTECAPAADVQARTEADQEMLRDLDMRSHQATMGGR